MLVVKGRVFFKGRLEAAAVGIADGKVVAVKKVLRGEETSDFGDSLILPGCVDAHVHLRDPGLTRKEDFPSGTRSAALGGVSTVADMPNTVPPVTTRVAFEEKAAALRGRAAVDYALYAAPRSGSAVPRMPDAIGFKVYMAETTGDLQIDEEAMEDVLEAAGDADRLVVVHAEDARRFTRPARGGLEGHHMARPKESEVSAIQALGKMSRGARVHVAHVTCTEALDAVPAGVTKEATPHHLLLDFRRDLKAFGKVNPPLRSPEDRGALWRAYVEGRVDLVASDHAPHAIEEKEELFPEAPSGLPGVATSFPLLLRRVKAGDLALERLVETIAEGPARVLGIEKGTIAVGRDADLVVVDPRDVRRVTAKRVRYACGWTPFEGMEACFPEAVLLRGEPVVEDGEPAAEGLGRMITAAKS